MSSDDKTTNCIQFDSDYIQGSSFNAINNCPDSMNFNSTYNSIYGNNCMYTTENVTSSSNSQCCFSTSNTSGVKRKLSTGSSQSSSLVKPLAVICEGKTKISQDIANYLDSIYAQHSIPPDWILATLHRHLDIDVKRLKLWFKRKQQREHRRLSESIPDENEAADSSMFSANTIPLSLETGDFAPTTRSSSQMSYSIDLIHKLVSIKQSEDVNSLMLQKYGHSLQYLVMTLFSHEATLKSGLIDLDRQVRDQQQLYDTYGETAAELIQILYHRVCDLESHLIYLAVDEYEREFRLRQLQLDMEKLREIIRETKVEPIRQSDDTNLSLMNEKWKLLQEKNCMIDSSDFYARNGISESDSVTIDRNLYTKKYDVQNNNDDNNNNECVSSKLGEDKISTADVSTDTSHLNKAQLLVNALDNIPSHELDALVACIEAVEQNRPFSPTAYSAAVRELFNSEMFEDNNVSSAVEGEF